MKAEHHPADMSNHPAGCSCAAHAAPADPHAARQPGQVSLTGSLVCADAAELLAVLAHAADHVAASRAEPGCLQFDLTQSDDPMVWTVAELFRDQDAYRAHQERTRTSDWGRATAAIERRDYDRRGID